jgi:hypothetical protein
MGSVSPDITYGEREGGREREREEKRNFKMNTV